jgi:hypothetical protein
MYNIYYSGIGEFFYFKPVIPAKAGIQILFSKEAGCPPGAGMTVKLPDSLFIYETKRVSKDGCSETRFMGGRCPSHTAF